ncbi:MAG: TM2 domain-containing protein [Planctomycetes bacterium]|nr:TM2 domain-containing protein [Planctomycetota bacterium]
MNENKSTGVAYLLWFFLGGFGAHRFYCGRTGSAFGMLGLSIGSVLTAPFLIGLLGFPALFVWWIVDAFLIGKWINEDACPEMMSTGGPLPGTVSAGSPTGTMETDEDSVTSAAA